MTATTATRAHARLRPLGAEQRALGAAASGATSTIERAT